MKWKYCDLTGHTFGDLVVIGLDHQAKKDDKYHSQRFWKCQCKCGNVSIVRTALLANNHTKSCGCKRRRNGKNHPNFQGVGDLSAHFFSHIKHNAKNRKIKFSVPINEMWTLFVSQNGKCALSGIPICLKSKTASLDRNDSSVGYVKGNIQWVHKDINIMKNVFDTDTFLMYCKRVNENCNLRTSQDRRSLSEVC